MGSQGQAQMGVLENIDLAVITFDERGLISAEVSAVARQLFSLPDNIEKHEIGESFIYDFPELKSPQLREDMQAWVLMAYKVFARLSWKKIRDLCPLERLERDELIYSCRYVPVSEGDDLQGIMMICQDVTDDVLLQQSRDEQREIQRAESETLSVMMSAPEDAMSQFLIELKTRSATLESLIERGLNHGSYSLALRCAHTIKGSSSLLGVREITELAHQLETVMTRHKGDLLDGKMSETFFLAYGALRHRCAQVLVWGERMKLFSQEGVKPREVRVRTSLLKEILDHIEMESPSSSSSFWDERKSELYALTTVPCIELFRRFDKMILQLSDEFGKRAKLSCSKGGDIRLPYSLWSKWIDPLNHLLRNAMAHGVEGATERFEGQKPSVASIDLSFSLADGFFSIEVSDDGRGIDAEKLYGEWLKKQNSPKGREMSQEEKLQLMFEAGISTAEAVDVYSGRGVGMDIVKAMVESLKGEISIESKWGEGTVIKLRVPFDD